MKRNEFTARVKVDAFALANGRCQKCGAKLATGNIHYDHIIPCGLDSSGGDASLGNCQCVCKSCHADKTSIVDVPAIAKAKRNHRTAIGVRRQRSITGWKTMSGDPVRASRER